MTTPEPRSGLLADPSRCRKFTDDVAIHWFPSTQPGTTCHCGEMTQPEPPAEDQSQAEDAFCDRCAGLIGDDCNCPPPVTPEERLARLTAYVNAAGWDYGCFDESIGIDSALGYGNNTVRHYLHLADLAWAVDQLATRKDQP